MTETGHLGQVALPIQRKQDKKDKGRSSNEERPLLLFSGTHGAQRTLLGQLLSTCSMLRNCFL